MKKLDIEVKEFSQKWGTTEEKVIELLSQVGKQNGIRAVCSDIKRSK